MLNSISIIATMRCDLKCQHCLRGFSRQHPDFPIELLDKILPEAMPFGVRHVGITGGEPDLHPQFQCIVEKAVAYGFTWHFVSHGQRTESYLPIMEKFKDKISHVTLSIDGAKTETHDEIRKCDGAFEKVVASAKHYVELGYKVRINSTLNRKNKNEVSELIRLARNIGAYSIVFAGVIPTSWNTDLILNEEESLALYKQIMTLQKESRIDIQVLSSLYTFGGVNFCSILNLRELTFNSHGELIFCCDTIEHGAAIGSLYEFSLSALIERWIEQSNILQIQRARQISSGDMGERFDTCMFCNIHFST